MSAESLQEFKERIKPPEPPALVDNEYLLFLATASRARFKIILENENEESLFDEIKKDALIATYTLLFNWAKQLHEDSVATTAESSNQSIITDDTLEQSDKPLTPEQHIANIEHYQSEVIPSISVFNLEIIMINFILKSIIMDLSSGKSENALKLLSHSVETHSDDIATKL